MQIKPTFYACMKCLAPVVEGKGKMTNDGAYCCGECVPPFKEEYDIGYGWCLKRTLTWPWTPASAKFCSNLGEELKKLIHQLLEDVDNG